MKYLLRNRDTKIVEMVFDHQVNATPPLQQIEVPDEVYKDDMLKSIFRGPTDYVPFPGGDGSWWTSNGIEWIDTRDRKHVWALVRRTRNRELQRCDWTQLPDVPMKGTQRAAWTEYRTKLRNVPNETNDPLQAERRLKQIIDNEQPQ